MDKKYTRRDFLKIAGAGSALAGATALGCSPAGNKNTVSDAPAGEMTYRTNPGNGDKVSLLGYGCMRWPMTKDEEGRDVIDQETVNGLIDYAMEHGVNYYDTSPVYVQGQSERASAIALNRHPRKSYYLATKLSNFSNWSRENSMLMYRKSFENMETDYFDYYLLHSIGNGGTKMFEERYFDNGMADFLMKEREAGRIRNLGFSFHGTQETFDYALSLHDKVHWDFVQIQLNYVDWKHASGRNVNADYLYSELEKRGIPAVIMEPLLGGRLSKVPQHVADRLLERNPDGSVASWAFRFAGRCPDRPERHDLYGTSDRQRENLLPACSPQPGRTRFSGGNGAADDDLPYGTVQRLQILHALPLRHRHPGHPPALQQVRE